MNIFATLVKRANPSPVQPLDAMMFMPVKINLGGPVPNPQMPQLITMYDRSVQSAPLSEIYYADNSGAR